MNRTRHSSLKLPSDTTNFSVNKFLDISALFELRDDSLRTATCFFIGKIIRTHISLNPTCNSSKNWERGINLICTIEFSNPLHW